MDSAPNGEEASESCSWRPVVTWLTDWAYNRPHEGAVGVEAPGPDRRIGAGDAPADHGVALVVDADGGVARSGSAGDLDLGR